MAKQNSTEKLKEQIRLLEIRKADEGKILKVQFEVTCEGLKPINLLKSSAKEFSSSVELRETVLESSAILVAGLISKTILNSTKGGPLLKLLSSLLQLGATGLVGKYSVQIQDYIIGLVNRLLKKPDEEQSE
jgi:hypothetical protein